MLTFAAIALILPAAFQAAPGTTPATLGGLSIAISVLLLVVYVLYLTFTLVTHSSLFAGSHEPDGAAHAPPWSIRRSVLVLGGATALIAWISEIMVGVIVPTTREFGLSTVFVGVFVVAIVGNAAEHATAITAAMQNRMELALSITFGSSVQIAVFVAPVLVLASLFLGPSPLNLAFTPGMVLMVLLSVIIAGRIAGDGRSDWLVGLQLLAVYLIFGLTFFFMPTAPLH